MSLIEQEHRLVDGRADFCDPAEAQMAKGHAGVGQGIECFLHGRQCQCDVCRLRFRVRLQVFAGSDEAAAVQLLMEAELGVGGE